MNERQNRTIICSVLFLDLVGYSRRPVAEQLKLRERFNALLREALKGVTANDRIILDTGDGAAVTFLGDPEDALFMALTLRDLVAQAAGDEQGLELRSGINLGPVKLVKDLNGRPNIIGDGINVAQRIMGFSQPGQVLISRSYYEVVSRLSDDYAQLFENEGVRTDKHVREHQVYGVIGDRPIPVRPSDEVPHSGGFSGLGQAGALLARLQEFAALPVRRLYASPRLSTMFVAIAILAIGGAVRASRETPGVLLAERRAAPAIERVTLVVSPLPPPAAGPAEMPAKTAALLAEGAAAVSMAGSLPTPPQAPSARSPAPRKVAAAKPAKAAQEKSVQQDDSQVAVSFVVFPWGEVYVDGKHLGVSPPIRRVQLPPGRHQIEFRNTTFSNHVQVVDIKPGEPVTVRHKFDGGASQ
jgi:class 3 adenylate cyclase